MPWFAVSALAWFNSVILRASSARCLVGSSSASCLFIYLFSFAYNYTNNNMYTTISVQPQSANVEKLVSSFGLNLEPKFGNMKFI